jgi:hypothetical protein
VKGTVEAAKAHMAATAYNRETHRLADVLAAFVNRQTDPRLSRRPLGQQGGAAVDCSSLLRLPHDVSLDGSLGRRIRHTGKRLPTMLT